MPIGPWELLLIFVFLIAWPTFVAGNAYVKRPDLPASRRLFNAFRLGCAAMLIGIVVFVIAALLIAWLIT